jgi:hypothetical protein
MTTKLYDTVWPAADTVVGEADLVKVKAGFEGSGIVTDDAVDVTGGPDGGVPVAVALFITDPLFTSVWVSV